MSHTLFPVDILSRERPDLPHLQCCNSNQGKHLTSDISEGPNKRDNVIIIGKTFYLATCVPVSELVLKSLGTSPLS